MTQSMKETLLHDYFGKINLRDPGLNLNRIEEDLVKLLGERPSVNPTWVKDVMLSEDRKNAREIKRLDSISVVFTDLDEKIKKIEFRV
jgi:hypothetical protein